MKTITPISHVILASLVLLFGPTIQTQAQTMVTGTLAYWSFENIGTFYSSATIGKFSTTAAAYGETTNTTTKTMSGNTNGILGSGAYLDFNNVTGYVNGGYTPGTGAGWGSFTNSGHNALILSTNSSTLTQGMSIVLNTSGYDSITLSFDYRAGGSTSTAETWFYDNGTQSGQLDAFSTTAAQAGNWYTYSKTFTLADLANQNSLTLSLTYLSGAGGGSFSLDNLTITAIIPEPATWTLMTGGLLVISVLWLRKSRAG
jgi:hypothetical protein